MNYMQQLLKINKKYIWLISLLALGLILAFVKDIIKNILLEQAMTYYWIIVVSLAVIWLAFTYKPVSRINRLLFALGYIIRLGILLFGTWVVNIYTLVWESEGDVALYREASLANYFGYDGGFPADLQFYYNLAYTKLLDKAYYIVGANDFSGTFLNILAFTLLSWIIIIFSIRVSKELDYRIFALLQFMPVTIWLNTRLLRESILTLCILLSLICFYLFYTRGQGIIYFIAAILASALSFCLHSGNIVICLVYLAFAVSFFVKKYGSKLILPMALVIVATCVILFQLPAFRAYFGTYFNMDRIYTALGLAEETTSANTAYLRDFPRDNIFLLLVYGVLKYIYFWFSPMIWDASSLSYIFIMIVDALPFVILWVLCLKNKPYRPFCYLLILQSLVYAIGTSAAGTAMRHRNIFLPVFMLMYIISQKDRARECSAGECTS